MISLLLLTHNRAPMVKRCLRSLAHTLNDHDVEWIILDNGSTDGISEWLLAMARRLERVRIILSAVNLGVAGGRARLLTEARGDVLVFLDSDIVVIDERWLDRLLDPLQSPATGLCGPAGNWITTDAAGRWVWFQPDSRPGPIDVVSGYCQAFRREIIERGVAPDLSYGKYWLEDSQMCLDIKTLGYQIVCTGDIGIQHIYAGSGDDGSGPEKFNLFASRFQGKGLIRAERKAITTP